MCLSAPIARGKGPGISFNPPPAHNSNYCNYMLLKLQTPTGESWQQTTTNRLD